MPLDVIVVGAGPVGCLAALGLAQRGCNVQIFDSRRDPRPALAKQLGIDNKRSRSAASSSKLADELLTSSGQALPAGAISSDPQVSNPAATAPAAHRSINLAISTRGLTGLKSVTAWKGGKGKGKDLEHDLADLILSEAVPMKARMIHTSPNAAQLPETIEELCQVTNPDSLGVAVLSQLYSTVGECINSVDRARLNNLLLDQALRHPNIDVSFEHKLLRADLDRALPQDALGTSHSVELLFEDAGTRPTSNKRDDSSSKLSRPPQGDLLLKQCDLVIGCDGHHSKLRNEMLRFVPRMDFSQSYIDSGYVELSIPKRSDHPDPQIREGVQKFTSIASAAIAERSSPTLAAAVDDNEFLLDPNHLHIWPRHDFMLIALPNRDGSFTCTLFAPFNIFRRHLTPKALLGDDGSILMDDEVTDRAEITPDSILAFFREHFADALPLLTPDAVVRDLTSRKPSNLGMVSVNPYTYKERAILLGDSAHAMVPFYGQGLNCGLEDVRVMLDWIDKSVLEGSLRTARADDEQEAASSAETSPGLGAVDAQQPSTPSSSDGTPETPPFELNSIAAAASSATSVQDEEIPPPKGSAVARLQKEAEAAPAGWESPRTSMARTLSQQEKERALAAAIFRSGAAANDTDSAVSAVELQMDDVRRALRQALDHYSQHRRADLLSISDLAIRNYREMSSHVVSPAYLLRMKLDGVLMRTLPQGWWKSLYTMVTFSNERYSEVTKRRDWQDGVIHRAVEGAITVAGVGLAAGAWFIGKQLVQRAQR